ncbi:MAG: response regulator [Chloroflexota bacterium]
MNNKQHILIVESHEDWLGILRQALPKEQFEVQTARNYEEAMFALQKQAFALALVDPVLDGTVQTQHINQGGHNGLELLAKMTFDFPNMRVIVVSGSMGREMLRNAPELSATLPLVQKQNWELAQFTALVNRVLTTQDGYFAEAEFEPPAISAPLALTGPLSATGMTGPLSTGLMPPPAGSRPGMSRVLIVEGDLAWQHRLASLMDREGYFWRVAPDYEQGMERLRLETFHFVLLDLMIGEWGMPMTEGKGWPLLAHIIAQAPKTKVIVASGHVTRGDLAKLFMNYPIKGFIDKDAFNEQELLASLHEMVMGPALRVTTLGGFHIWRDDKAVTSFGDNYAERLIQILIARRGENVSVDELTECLWPGTDPKTAYANLGATIGNARTSLEPDLPRPNDSHFILRNGANYLFNLMANVEIDAEQLRRLVSEGRHHERRGEITEALQDYEAARAIYQGDYLPSERFERWAIQERSALQALYTGALNRIADLYAAMDKLDLAVEAASRSLQVDAYNESTYRRLMRYHACKEDRAAAMAVYRALVKLFSEFFNEEPSAVAKQLSEDIEAGRPVTCVEAESATGEWRHTEL